jgi:hypothetical protein
MLESQDFVETLLSRNLHSGDTMRTSADAASELPVAHKKTENYRQQVKQDTYIKQSTFSVNSH